MIYKNRRNIWLDVLATVDADPRVSNQDIEAYINEYEILNWIIKTYT